MGNRCKAAAWNYAAAFCCFAREKQRGYILEMKTIEVQRSYGGSYEKAESGDSGTGGIL